jgi:hypothetical protein
MKAPIPFRSHSPYGWWVASYILRASWNDEPNPPPDQACLAWENTIILQAPDREVAFAKAQQFARQEEDAFFDESNKSRTGRWLFEGLTSLLPIHDELGDGAEIIWTVHEDIPLSKVRARIKSKPELEVFDDTEPSVEA